MNTYIESIQFKLKSAAYHHHKCLQAMNEPIKFETEEEQLVAVASEFTAMMLTYHSILDILAQFINEKRQLELNKNRLYLSSINIESEKISDLKDRLMDLKEKTKYLSDFCNTNKHRNLVRISEKYVFISINLPVKEFFVDSFTRNNIVYTSQGLHNLIFETYNNLEKLVKEILSQV